MIELALDRIEATIAAELSAHVAAFARTHSAGTPAPPAPPVLTDPTTVATARRAVEDPAVAARGRKLLRLVALLAIEMDRAVRPLARDGGWPELGALARARDAAARRVFGRGFLELAHDVFEVPAGQGVAAAEAATGAVTAPRIGVESITRIWEDLTLLAAPALILAPARPRCFVVRTGREVIVVARPDATVSAWSAVLHELGHAWAALSGREPARTIDETIAVAASRLLARADVVARWWPDAAADEIAGAAAALDRRHAAIAATLDAIERKLYAGDDAVDAARAHGLDDRAPPWALWHDPGAQAAYVAAHRARWPIDRLDDLVAHLA